MAVVPLTCQATSKCLTWCLPNNHYLTAQVFGPLSKSGSLLSCSQLFFKSISQTQLNALHFGQCQRNPTPVGTATSTSGEQVLDYPGEPGKTIVTGQESSPERLDSKKKNLKSIETAALAQSLYWASSGVYPWSALSTAGSRKGPELPMGPDALHRFSNLSCRPRKNDALMQC